MTNLEKLQQENADLRRMNQRLKEQLAKALEAVAENHNRDLTCAPEMDRTAAV
jgi:cell division septum initiation protein DivIVA